MASRKEIIGAVDRVICGKFIDADSWPALSKAIVRELEALGVLVIEGPPDVR